MKYHSKSVYFRYLQDLNESPDHILETECDGVFDNFNKDYAWWVVDLAKRMGKSYVQVGVMDLNDLIQESNSSFFNSWSKIDWSRVEKVATDERQFFVWGFLKKSIRLSVRDSIKDLKDGIRIPQYVYKQSDSIVDGFLTNIFPQFFDSQYTQVASDFSNYKNDILSDFLELTLDKYLDRKFNGERNPKGIERAVIRESLGLDGTRPKPLKEIGEFYGKTEGHIKKIKSTALESLRDNSEADWVEESFMDCVSFFVMEEEIDSSSAAYDWAKKKLSEKSNQLI